MHAGIILPCCLSQIKNTWYFLASGCKCPFFGCQKVLFLCLVNKSSTYSKSVLTLGLLSISQVKIIHTQQYITTIWVSWTHNESTECGKNGDFSTYLKVSILIEAPQIFKFWNTLYHNTHALHIPTTNNGMKIKSELMSFLKSGLLHLRGWLLVLDMKRNSEVNDYNDITEQKYIYSDIYVASMFWRAKSVRNIKINPCQLRVLGH